MCGGSRGRGVLDAPAEGRLTVRARWGRWRTWHRCDARVIREPVQAPGCAGWCAGDSQVRWLVTAASRRIGSAPVRCRGRTKPCSTSLGDPLRVLGLGRVAGSSVRCRRWGSQRFLGRTRALARELSREGMAILLEAVHAGGLCVGQREALGERPSPPGLQSPGRPRNEARTRLPGRPPVPGTRLRALTSAPRRCRSPRGVGGSPPSPRPAGRPAADGRPARTRPSGRRAAQSDARARSGAFGMPLWAAPGRSPATRVREGRCRRRPGQGKTPAPSLSYHASMRTGLGWCRPGRWDRMRGSP